MLIKFSQTFKNLKKKQKHLEKFKKYLYCNKKTKMADKVLVARINVFYSLLFINTYFCLEIFTYDRFFVRWRSDKIFVSFKKISIFVRYRFCPIRCGIIFFIFFYKCVSGNMRRSCCKLIKPSCVVSISGSVKLGAFIPSSSSSY